MTLTARLCLEGITTADASNMSPIVDGRRDVGHIIDQQTYPVPGTIGTGLPIVGPPVSGMLTPSLKFTYIIGNACSFTLPIDTTAQTTYSAAWSMCLTDYPQAYTLVGDDRFFWAYEGTTRRWGLLLQSDDRYPFLFDFVPHDYTRSRRLSIVAPDGTTGTLASGAWQMPVNQHVRIEVSVAGGVVTVRAYVGTSTTPATTLTYTPASTSADRMSWGTTPTWKANLGCPVTMCGWHVWSGSSTADGAFPDFRYSQPAWTFSTFDGTTEGTRYPVTSGKVAELVSGTETDRLAMFTNGSQTGGVIGSREIVPVTYSSTTYTYGSRTNQNYILYLPSGTAPAGGWPVIQTVQSDFFNSGGSSTLDVGFRNRALLAGFAVASTGINNASVSTITPNPSVDGVWPSFILDVKRATRHLQAGGTGYGINPAKVITAGHSAGGYCAAGAMITRDLANNGYGVDLRLGSGADPAYLGSIMLGSPIDFGVSRSWDVSHPYFGVYPNLMGQGLIYSTLAAIKGYAANVAAGSMAVAGMGLNDLIVANASNVRPIRYHQGGSDITIAPGNLDALVTACTTAGVTLTTLVEPGIPHSYLTRENSSSAIAWALTLI